MEKQRRAGLPNTGYAPRRPGPDSIAGMRSIVAGEQQRRAGLEAEVAKLRAGEAEQHRISAEVGRLRTELASERERSQTLQGELTRLSTRRAEELTPAEMEAMQAQLTYERKRVRTLEAEVARLRRGKSAEGAGSSEDLTRLRQRLDQETRRRLEVEKAFARLREETAVPPFGAREVSEVELLAVKEELVRTRQALAAERALRQTSTNEGSNTGTLAGDTPDVQEWRERVHTLERERDELRRQVQRINDALHNGAPPADAR